MIKTVYIFLFFPLFHYGQLMNKEFSSNNYKYIDLIDNSNNYSNDENKIINILINDDFTGELEIKNSNEQLIHKYSLDKIKGIDGEEASAMLFEKWKLLNIIDNKNYFIYIMNKSSSYDIIIKYENKLLEQYQELKEWK